MGGLDCPWSPYSALCGWIKKHSRNFTLLLHLLLFVPKTNLCLVVLGSVHTTNNNHYLCYGSTRVRTVQMQDRNLFPESSQSAEQDKQRGGRKTTSTASCIQNAVAPPWSHGAFEAEFEIRAISVESQLPALNRRSRVIPWPFSHPKLQWSQNFTP